MDIKEAMKARHSVRQYKNKVLNKELISALRNEIAACNKERRAAYPACHQRAKGFFRLYGALRQIQRCHQLHRQ